MVGGGAVAGDVIWSGGVLLRGRRFPVRVHTPPNRVLTVLRMAPQFLFPRTTEGRSGCWEVVFVLHVCRPAAGPPQQHISVFVRTREEKIPEVPHSSRGDPRSRKSRAGTKQNNQITQTQVRIWLDQNTCSGGLQENPHLQNGAGRGNILTTFVTSCLRGSWHQRHVRDLINLLDLLNFSWASGASWTPWISGSPSFLDCLDFRDFSDHETS